MTAREPPDLLEALERGEALEAWRALPPSQRAEYLDWVAEAKGADTRTRRIELTVDRVRGLEPKDA